MCWSEWCCYKSCFIIKKMFNKLEQMAISEKFEQLKKFQEGNLTKEELSKIIIKRRVNWLRRNFGKMLIKYGHLHPVEQAYKIIFLEHMKINPKYSIVEKMSPTKIRIESYNFCPYFEACKMLNLDTKYICKEIGEPSFREMIKLINPNLKFSRNYNNIHPKNKEFCEEFIELK